jgi:predicted nucleotidyltransferase
MSTQFGLNEAVIKKLMTTFSRYPEIENVTIYGSRANGNYKPGSDIDVVLKGNELNTILLNRIEHDIDELNLPYQVDLSIFHQIDNEELLMHIKNIGKPLSI